MRQARRESLSVKIRDLAYGISPIVMYNVRDEGKSFDQMYRGLWKL